MTYIHIISRPRVAGKTRKAIELCAKEHAYLVVSSHREAHFAYEMAKAMGLEIPWPMTYSELINRRYIGMKHRQFNTGREYPVPIKVVIDNVDLFLSSTFNDINILAATITGEPNG